jgi:hypothetical protein
VTRKHTGLQREREEERRRGGEKERKREREKGRKREREKERKGEEYVTILDDLYESTKKNQFQKKSSKQCFQQ